MPDCKLTCNYCHHQWQANIFSMEYVSCSVCGDKNIKAVQVDETTGDQFGYNSQEPRPDAYQRNKKS